MTHRACRTRRAAQPGATRCLVRLCRRVHAPIPCYPCSPLTPSAPFSPYLAFPRAAGAHFCSHYAAIDPRAQPAQNLADDFFHLFRPNVAPAAPHLLPLFWIDSRRARLTVLRLASLAPDAGPSPWCKECHRGTVRKRRSCPRTPTLQGWGDACGGGQSDQERRFHCLRATVLGPWVLVLGVRSGGDRFYENRINHTTL